MPRKINLSNPPPPPPSEKQGQRQVFCEDKTNDTRLYPAIPRMPEVFSHTSRERRKGRSAEVLRRSIPLPPKENTRLARRVTRQ